MLKFQFVSILIILVLTAILSSRHIRNEDDQKTGVTMQKLRGWKVRTTPWTLTEAFDLKIGDVILSVNGSAFTASNDDFRKLRRHCEAGKPVTIIFERNGKTYTKVEIVELSEAKRPGNYEFGAYNLEPMDSSISEESQ